jgi:hypothetical protein
MNLPGFTADTSLYRTTVHYQGAYDRVGRSNRAVDLAQQFLPLAPDGIAPKTCPPKGLGCGPDPDNPGACCHLFRTIECELTCLSPCICPPPPPVCGPCLLPTDSIRQKILAGLPIDPATDLIFEQTCHQGANSFTQGCEICSQETKIGLPIVSDKCIKVCMRGFDPASIRVDVRDC